MSRPRMPSSMPSNGAIPGSGNIKVVVRCRPMNSRELARGAKPLIRMTNSTQTYLDPPSDQSGGREKRSHAFTFDQSYFSATPKDDPEYASQQTIYDDLGVELLDHSFKGYNTCIFAYGQTGSGKSYSMMGYGKDKGIIPLTTEELFRRVETQKQADAESSYQVEVSYIEIYNEKVRDLLNPRNTSSLKVREHPSLGPYVEDLSRLVVENNEEMMSLMDEGNKARTIGATNMNETSSRSHAVFTVILTQRKHDPVTNMNGEKVSKISLVDLAGSERATSTGATGARLKEGANINRSLTTLGKVIQALAAASTDSKQRRKKDDFVPYRDSTLTWLLKESLGGNSRTCMIATISPADYEETLSTLRYADQAKKIKTNAMVNEDPNAKLIRELREELEVLRVRSGGASQADSDLSIPLEQQIVTYQTRDGQIKSVTKLELQENLETTEKLMASLNESWEDKLLKTAQIQVEREQALQDLGITVDKNLIGVHAPRRYPHLVNLNEDPLANECLVYQLKPGETTVGSLDSDAAIKLSGGANSAVRCVFCNQDGRVSLASKSTDAVVLVNGARVSTAEPIALRARDRVIIDFHIFRFASPEASRMKRISALEGSESSRPATPDEESSIIDWSFARHEAAVALRGTEFERLNDNDLEVLYNDIVKVKTSRHTSGISGSLSTLGGSRFTEFESKEGDENLLETGASAHAGNGIEGFSVDTVPTSASMKAEMSRSGSSGRVEGLAKQWQTVERDVLKQQVKDMASDVAALRHQARLSSSHRVALPADRLTAHEERIAARCLKNWKRVRLKRNRREIMALIPALSEANGIARGLGVQVTYDWMLSDSMSLTSCQDASFGLDGLAEEVTAHDEGSACTTVYVARHDDVTGTINVMDIPTFQQRHRTMRYMSSQAARSSGGIGHFRLQDAFGNTDPISRISSAFALVRLAPLAAGRDVNVVAQILDRMTYTELGTCRIQLHPSADFGRDGHEKRRLQILVVLDDIAWNFPATCPASIHAEVDLASFLGGDQGHIDQSGRVPKAVGPNGLRTAITMPMSYSGLCHFRDDYGSIKFFGVPDKQRMDILGPPAALASLRVRGRVPAGSDTQSHIHTLSAQVEILELSPSGNYVAVLAEEDATLQQAVFKLRQGTQRRLKLRICHDSPGILHFQPELTMTLGPVRREERSLATATQPTTVVSIDFKGRIEVTGTASGGEAVAAESSWDSSLHHSDWLNRRTVSGEVICITMTISFALDHRMAPLTISQDMYAQVLDRNAGSTRGWLDIFRGVRNATCATWLLALCLGRSQLDQSVVLETNKRYEEWLDARQEARRRADVAATLSRLDGIELLPSGRRTLDSDSILASTIYMWRCLSGIYDPHACVGLCSEKAVIGQQLLSISLVSSVSLACKSATDNHFPNWARLRSYGKPAKSGSLRVYRPALDEWHPVWAVLRRPYLLLYETRTSTAEDCVISLAASNVRRDPYMAEALQDSSCFTLFSAHNSIVFATATNALTEEWVNVMSSNRLAVTDEFGITNGQ